MSIRIHKLAEELGLDNKEMMALLKERRIIGQDVKSVSSTVDKISAASLREEFAARRPVAVAAAPETAAIPAEAPAPESGPPRVNLPSGVFVKSRQDIEREREAASAAKAAALKAAAAPPPLQKPLAGGV